MKVRVAFMLEVDEGAWAAEYGLRPSEVRDDVRRLAEDAARDQVERLGLLIA